MGADVGAAGSSAETIPPTTAATGTATGTATTAAFPDGADAYIVYIIKSAGAQNLCTHPMLGDPACDVELADGSVKKHTEEWVLVSPLRPAYMIAEAVAKAEKAKA